MGYNRSFIAAIALAMLLTVLGHDALMAADPHASSNAGFHSHPDHDAHDHDASAPVDTIQCGPATGIHPTLSRTLDVDNAAVAPSLPSRIEELGGFRPHWSIAPDHPPDTRRALLQVYLN